jgi:hypothetical protein
MAERAELVVHGTMRGGGYYSAVTRGAKDAIDGAIPLVLAAIRRLPDARACAWNSARRASSHAPLRRPSASTAMPRALPTSTSRRCGRGARARF